MKASLAKKNILIVLYYYYPYVSGVSVYAKDLAEGLSREGHSVTVLTSRFDRSLEKIESINNVRVVRKSILFRIGKGVIMPTFWFDAILYSRKFDYVNSHLPMADTGLSCIFISKRKLVTTYHCDINLGDSLISKIVTFISMGLMKIQLFRSKKIVTTSNDYFMHSKMNAFKDKSIQIYPPIKTSDFNECIYLDLEKKLGIAEKSLKIGFVGRIVYEKGIKYLLECIPILAKGIDNFVIVIAGDYENIAGGSIKNELDAYLNKFPNNIIFTGYLEKNDLNKFYSMIDVLVLPSVDPLEAFGMVQVEAMLCGTPVVASDMPGVREVVKSTGHGLLSKIKSPSDISEKIIEVVYNKKRYTPNRKKVEEIFSQKKSIQKYEDLFS